MERAVTLFEGKRGLKLAAHADDDRLYGEIGRLKMARDWLKKKVRTMSVATRMSWVDRQAGVAVARHCDLAGVARATVYGRQLVREESEEDRILMRLIDEAYTRRPFYGSRRMVVDLARQGYAVNRKRVQH